MKAYIYYNNTSVGIDYNGEGKYVLVTEDDKCIGYHYCSSRGFANHDLTVWCTNELKENNITEVYSNGELVWKDNSITDKANNDFVKANREYEEKYCGL